MENFIFILHWYIRHGFKQKRDKFTFWEMAAKFHARTVLDTSIESDMLCTIVAILVPTDARGLIF